MKKNIPYLIFAFVISGLLIHHFNNEGEIKECSRFTIATITGKSGGFSTAKTLNYEYKCDATVFLERMVKVLRTMISIKTSI